MAGSQSEAVDLKGYLGTLGLRMEAQPDWRD
jgi:hypothetical protein